MAGFLDGVLDGIAQVGQAATPIIQAVQAPKVAAAQAKAQTAQTISQAQASQNQPGALPKWFKPAVFAVGGIAVVAVLWQLFKPRRKARD